MFGPERIPSFSLKKEPARIRLGTSWPCESRERDETHKETWSFPTGFGFLLLHVDMVVRLGNMILPQRPCALDCSFPLASAEFYSTASHTPCATNLLRTPCWKMAFRLGYSNLIDGFNCGSLPHHALNALTVLLAVRVLQRTTPDIKPVNNGKCAAVLGGCRLQNPSRIRTNRGPDTIHLGLLCFRLSPV